MKLSIFDTLRRKERVFRPLDPKSVRMYVCGPTVYDFAHIGNARPVIVFDVLFRLLRHLYGAEHVVYVRNITDVDDKINARAAKEYPNLPLNQSIRAVTEKTEKQFHEDVKALGCLPPTHEPRATDYIEKMKELIELIRENGRAYVRDDHVLFKVRGLRSYGKLSRRSLDDMKSSARGEVAPKDNPTDFVLWKPSKHGEPAWPSPAGIETPGRPGWHIECSAMSSEFLGVRFDIHGGGVDLLFPHHENERAQSARAFKKLEMARYWMHNGFLQVEGEKMSKSLGNFLIIHDLLQKWPGEVLRLQMLNTHYRRPMDWTERMTRSAETELEDWCHLIGDLFGSAIGNSDARRPVSPGLLEPLCDDLNTPEALTFLRNSARQIRNDSEKALAFLCDCEFLGIMDRRHLGLLSREIGGNVSPEIMLRAFDLYQMYRPKMHNNIGSSVEEFRAKIWELGAEARPLPNGGFEILQREGGASAIQAMIEKRNIARKDRNFKEADGIRNELSNMGIELEDHKDGTTTWKMKEVS